MKSSIEKTIFWVLYCFYGIMLVAAWIHDGPENPYIGLIFAAASMIVWYLFLKAIFWIIRRCWRVLSVYIPRIPKTLWTFTLNRVRELGRAFRDE